MGRPTKEEQAAKLAEEAKPTLEQRIEVLESALARLAVCTGNANWLREYGIERWTPEKKHMSKKYA